jgi:predicted transcriptional regulator
MLFENCPECGRVYQKNSRNMCQACSKRVDKEVMDCKEYMWHNPKITTEELSRAINLNISRVYQIIKDGLIAKNYSNLTYPCESCGTQILKNRLCVPCLDNMNTLTNQLRQSLQQ